MPCPAACWVVGAALWLAGSNRQLAAHLGQAAAVLPMQSSWCLVCRQQQQPPGHLAATLLLCPLHQSMLMAGC